MKQLYIAAYNMSSGSARLLAEALDCWLIKNNNSRYRDSNRKMVINWGQTGRNWINTINRSENVSTALDKCSFFRTVGERVSTPPWTTDIHVASRWIEEGRTVVCRTLVRGHEGRGIVLADRNTPLVSAPLYTQYIPKRAEYRVHVVNNRIIAVQQKVRRRNDTNNANFMVRNSANGFIFQRNNINVPGDVTAQALLAVSACGLHFGGVDVIWNERQQRAYVLEINTAPGIEGTTVQNYADAFREMANVE